MVFLIEGIIVEGLGEGAYFMSMPHYKNEIIKKLGFDAFPGTLNIKTDAGNAAVLEKKSKYLSLDGFTSGNKTFGGVKCYISSLKGIGGAVVVPEFNKHKKDILEFIAPVHLKTKLKLKNGDKVTLELR